MCILYNMPNSDMSRYTDQQTQQQQRTSQWQPQGWLRGEINDNNSAAKRGGRRRTQKRRRQEPSQQQKQKRTLPDTPYSQTGSRKRKQRRQELSAQQRRRQK